MSLRIGTWTLSKKRFSCLRNDALDHEDDERADGDAPDVAHAAEDDHREDRERHVEAEQVRGHASGASRR